MLNRVRSLVIFGVVAVAAGAGPSLASAAECGGRTATIVGTPGDDTLNGTPGDDVIVGNGGNDRVFAGDGNDRVCTSGLGRDYIRGGRGNDTLYSTYDSGSLSRYTNPAPDVYVTGNQGNDVIVGVGTLAGDLGDDYLQSSGRDTPAHLYGGPGRDELRMLATGPGTINTADGGNDDDRVIGNNGGQTLHGGPGNDGVDGGAGNDSLYGDEGNDRLYGGSGRDTLFGGVGDDRIEGNENEDYLSGEAGNDRLFGGRGQDFILGGTGRDRIDGGPSYDRGRTGGQAGDTVIVPIDGIAFS
jgi:Ca2+-binding RTX toxin-like protein